MCYCFMLGCIKAKCNHGPKGKKGRKGGVCFEASLLSLINRFFNRL